MVNRGNFMSNQIKVFAIVGGVIVIVGASCAGIFLAQSDFGREKSQVTPQIEPAVKKLVKLSPSVETVSPTLPTTSAVTPTRIIAPTSKPSDAKVKKRLIEQLRRNELQLKEGQEKIEEESQKNRLCISEKQLADFHPHDKYTLSAECKKRLDELDRKIKNF
jgi:hypothetical protein